MNLKTGDRIGDYEILGVLGAGGMGSVYKARNVISDRVEALKVLLPNLAENQDLKDRFLREIKTSASLEHTNIAGLRTAFQSGDMLLMVMEFVEGETLDQRMKGGPLPMDEAVRFTAQVLDALEYAHSRGVVHRDIKPQNVMITSRGTAKLLDFGIAKASTDKQLTMTGTTLGSLYYMSPEQIRGEHVDARADLYSLGITLYEVVTGKRPFGGDSGFAIMAEHLQKQPVPPVELDPRVPPALNSVILRALAKSAADRYQDAGEFRAALRNVAFGPTTTQPSMDELTLPRAAAAAPGGAPPQPRAAMPPAPAAPDSFAAPAQKFVPPSEPLPPYAPQPAAFAPTESSKPRKRNTLALALIAVVAFLMVVAVGMVLASSYFFAGSETTMAAGKEPGLLDRISGIFGSNRSEEPKEADAAALESASEAPAVDPASIAQATQSLPSGTIDTGEPPAVSAMNPSSEQPGISASLQGAAAGNRVNAGTLQGSRGTKDLDGATKDIGVASATLAAQLESAQAESRGANAAGVQPGSRGNAESAPKVDQRALEQSRDFFAKLGIRAGTIQESARKLAQEQSDMGVSLRADIRASLKRMEYLMDRAEAALNDQDLDGAKTQMDAAEREVEKLEKFFRI